MVYVHEPGRLRRAVLDATIRLVPPSAAAHRPNGASKAFALGFGGDPVRAQCLDALVDLLVADRLVAGTEGYACAARACGYRPRLLRRPSYARSWCS